MSATPTDRAHRAPWRSAGLVVGVLMASALAGGSLALYLLAGNLYDYQDTVDGTHLPSVDAIVCLAGGRGRIAAAGDLWVRYWERAQAPLVGEPRRVPVLYISGMGPQSTRASFEAQLRRGVSELLKPEQVVLERESSNTEANAIWLARYARQAGWSRVLLVTSPYHMRRAQMIFGRTLLAERMPVEVETLSIFQEPFEPGEWAGSLHGIRVTMLEYLKWTYYRAFWRPEIGQ